MARVLIPLALLLIAFWVFSILDCALQPPTRHRGVSKPVWLLIVIVLPVVGGILWFIVGRSRRSQMAKKSNAPDDNPEFLGRLGNISDQDERIRRLEEELAALDAEDDDPRWQTRDPNRGSSAEHPSPTDRPGDTDPDAPASDGRA